jgi:CBS domain-containing protein
MYVAAILKVKGRNVVTTTADKLLLDVAKLLEQHDIGCIVIERADGQVAGIVSERDVVRAIGKSGAKVLKEPVSVYMTKTVVTAREADPIDRLMSEMTVHRFRHMPRSLFHMAFSCCCFGRMKKSRRGQPHNPVFTFTQLAHTPCCE